MRGTALAVWSVILLSISTTCSGLLWKRDPAFDNRHPNLTDSVSEILQLSAPPGCALACSARPWCNSFVYSPSSSQCSLYSIVADKNMTATSSTFSRFYYAQNGWCRREEGFYYDRPSGLCWKLMTDELKNWLNANTSCYDLGLSLVVLDTTSKKDIVARSLFVHPDSDLGYGGIVYIGASRPHNMWDAAWPGGVPDFYWLNGRWVDPDTDTKYWKVNEPNNVGQLQSVLAMKRMEGFGMHQLSDVYNHYETTYVCEKFPPT